MVQDGLSGGNGWRLGAGGRRGLAMGAAGFLMAVGGILGAGRIALSQQPEVVDVAARRAAILDHLGDVIQFYQTTRQPIQTAGEPNDVVYRDQATELAAEVADYAFQSAKAQAAYMASVPGSGRECRGERRCERSSRGCRRLRRMWMTQITDLKNQITTIDQQIAVAKPKDLAGLQARKKELEGALDLTNAMKESLGKIVGMARRGAARGWRETIGAAAEFGAGAAEQEQDGVVAADDDVDAAGESGVTTQASVLIDLMETRHALSEAAQERRASCIQEAVNLRTPLVTVLRGLIKQGQQISQQAANGGQAAPGATAGGWRADAAAEA